MRKQWSYCSLAQSHRCVRKCLPFLNTSMSDMFWNLKMLLIYLFVNIQQAIVVKCLQGLRNGLLQLMVTYNGIDLRVKSLISLSNGLQTNNINIVQYLFVEQQMCLPGTSWMQPECAPITDTVNSRERQTTKKINDSFVINVAHGWRVSAHCKHYAGSRFARLFLWDPFAGNV